VTRVSALEGHRLWAPAYESGVNPLLALERRAMRERLNSINASCVIDVACGTGQALSAFQKCGSSVFGVDACREMLTEAVKYPRLRGRLTSGTAECLPFRTGCADLVLCSLALGYFDDLDSVFAEFARVAVPGGSIAVSDIHPDALVAGWTRSFSAGGTRFELDHYCRSPREVERSAARAGLNQCSYSQVKFDEPERPIFRQTGRDALFEELRKMPALFIAVWRGPC
jgi:malonyl-CoA O-methyltransferase